MQFDRVVDVLVVCGPVFAVMGLGKVLERRGWLGQDRRVFINNLVYYLSLPALIFREVAQQRFATFLDPTLTLWPMAGIAVVGVVTLLVGRVVRFRGTFAAAFIFCTFWANVSYMGFPLCRNAFGGPGMTRAAIYNAFVMPTFIMMAYALIAIHSGGRGGAISRRQAAKQAVVNPIVISAFLGIGVSLFSELLRDRTGALALPGAMMGAAELAGSFLALVGDMGLPLALLAVGASIHWKQTKSHLGALAWSVGAKLVLLPLVTMSFLRATGDTDATSVGVAVMLSAMPNAVGSYVVSRKIGVEEGFVASALVMSTALSVITLPIWLYIVM